MMRVRKEQPRFIRIDNADFYAAVSPNFKWHDTKRLAEKYGYGPQIFNDVRTSNSFQGEDPFVFHLFQIEGAWYYLVQKLHNKKMGIVVMTPGGVTIILLV